LQVVFIPLPSRLGGLKEHCDKVQGGAPAENEIGLF